MLQAMLTVLAVRADNGYKRKIKQQGVKYRYGKTYDPYDSFDEDFGRCLHCDNYAQTDEYCDTGPRYIHVALSSTMSSPKLSASQRHAMNGCAQRNSYPKENIINETSVGAIGYKSKPSDEIVKQAHSKST